MVLPIALASPTRSDRVRVTLRGESAHGELHDLFADLTSLFYIWRCATWPPTSLSWTPPIRMRVGAGLRHWATNLIGLDASDQDASRGRAQCKTYNSPRGL